LCSERGENVRASIVYDRLWQYLRVNRVIVVQVVVQ
jgi:hypothetical protein